MTDSADVLSTVPADVSAAVAGSAPGWPLVLYFHHVHPRLDHYTSLTPAAFERGLETVLSCYGPALDPALPPDGTAPASEPSVLITFDDGHRDNLEYALPVLDRLGIRALFFVITGLVDDESCHDRSMNWSELAGLIAAGHQVGAHTVSHRKLPELSPEDQQAEIGESLRAVRERLRVPAPPLAYPYGLVPTAADVPTDTLAFGTVKAAPRPWSTARHDIRRTYLPVGREHLWPWLCQEWRKQWRPSR